jgi:hypothetical protein
MEDRPAFADVLIFTQALRRAFFFGDLGADTERRKVGK